MILLLKKHIYTLRRLVFLYTSARVNSSIFLLIIFTLISKFRQCANLERLWVRAKNEVVTRRTETTCSDRLVVFQLSQLLHMTYCRVCDWLNVTNNLLQIVKVGSRGCLRLILGLVLWLGRSCHHLVFCRRRVKLMTRTRCLMDNLVWDSLLLLDSWLRWSVKFVCSRVWMWVKAFT